MGDEQILELEAAYERLAAEADANADGLTALGMRHGWNEPLAERAEELRHQAATNRELTQDVRYGMGDRP